jgi:hypothetical protein
MKCFSDDFMELVKNNHINETKVSEIDLYRMELVNYPEYIRVKIEYRGDDNVYFPMVYRYVRKGKLDLDENTFFNFVKNELNWIIERCQTLIEEI